MANPQTPHSPQENTAPDAPAAADRRKLLRNWLRGMIAIGGALFLYPLVRFASFQTPRKPHERVAILAGGPKAREAE